MGRKADGEDEYRSNLDGCEDFIKPSNEADRFLGALFSLYGSLRSSQTCNRHAER